MPGSKTQTLAYNGFAVGPLIRVRLGDTVQVDVMNKDIPEGTSVHWRVPQRGEEHGQDLPGASWADGVAGVSQNPIPVKGTFSYRFRAAPAGTFWYHSHTGEQYADGLRGPLVVEDPADPHRALYDADLDAHVLVLADVFPRRAADTLRELEAAGMGAMGSGAMGGGAAGGAGVAVGGEQGRVAAGGVMAGAPPAGSGIAAMAGMTPSGRRHLASSGQAGPMPAGMAASAGAKTGGGLGSTGGGMGSMGGDMGDGMGAAAMPTSTDAALAAPRAPPAAAPSGCAPPGFDLSDAPWGGVQVNGRGATSPSVTAGFSAASSRPYVITVSPGKRYRLRFVGGMSSWALRVAPGGGHSLDVIALDGRPVALRRAAGFVISPGERVDAVLAADRPVGNYWLDISTLAGDNAPAVIHYAGAPDPLQDAVLLAARRPRICFDGAATSAAATGSGGGGGAARGVLDLKNATFRAVGWAATEPVPKAADRTFPIYLADPTTGPAPAAVAKQLLAPAAAAARRGFAPSLGGGCPAAAASAAAGAGSARSAYCWSLNWNVFEAPKTPALFPGSAPTARTYMLEARQGEVVDLVLVNPSRMVHPMHLHGSGFRVLAAGNGPAVVAGGGGVAAALAPRLALNLRDPPVKDTVAVPQAVGDGPEGWGYSILRFRADNAGAWAFHCHIELHASAGMVAVLAVKPRDPKGVWLAPKGAACGAAP